MRPMISTLRQYAASLVFPGFRFFINSAGFPGMTLNSAKFSAMISIIVMKALMQRFVRILLNVTRCAPSLLSRFGNWLKGFDRVSAHIWVGGLGGPSGGFMPSMLPASSFGPFLLFARKKTARSATMATSAISPTYNIRLLFFTGTLTSAD